MNKTLGAKTLALAATACAGALILTGCSTAATASTPSGAGSARAARTPGANRIPGTFGIIAEVSGKTLQLQGSSGQTAVTYSDATSFTRQAAGTAADLVAGACVSVRGTAAGSAAASITISPAVNGQCQGFGGGDRPAGGMPSGSAPSGAPADAPQGGGMSPGGMPSANPGEGAPSAMPSGRGNGFGVMAFGTVVSVAGDTLTISESRPGGGATASPTTSTATVTLGSSTAITKTVAATASAVKVGLCAWANGTPDGTGTVAATSIRLSDAVNGACTQG